MKKRNLGLLVALLVVLMFFVGCSNENEMPDETTSLMFVNSSSRALISQNPEFDADAYVWKYTAVKADEGFSTGQTTEAKNVANTDGGTGLNYSVGPFSLGYWDFTLYAYDNEALVFNGSANGVKITKDNTTVNVVVEAQKTAGGRGDLILPATAGFLIGERSFSADDVDEVITIVDQKSGSAVSDYIVETTDDGKRSIALPSGNYYIMVTYTLKGDVDVELGTGFTPFSIWDNLDTEISGTLEPVDTDINFGAEDGTVHDSVASSEIKADDDTTLVVGSAPADTTNASDEVNTTISIPAGAISDGAGKTAEVSVKAYDAETAGDFTFTSVEDNTAVVGVLDITLSVGGAGYKDSFADGKVATVTTYVTTGLSGVAVKYEGEGDDPTGMSYDSESGKLVFTTSHFSRFVVVSENVVLNVSTGTYYASFAEAVQDISDGNVIKLLGNVTEDLAGTLYIETGATIDLNGKSLVLTPPESTTAIVTQPGTGKEVKFTGGDITINMSDSPTISAVGAIDGVLTLDNVQFKSTSSAIMPHSATVNVRNQSVVEYACWGISTNNVKGKNAQINISDSTVQVLEGNVDSAAVMMNNYGSISITGSTITAGRQCVIVRGGEAVLKNVDLVKTGDHGTDLYTGSYGNGNEVAEAVIFLGSDKGTVYTANSSVTLKGEIGISTPDTYEGHEIYMAVRPSYKASFDATAATVDGADEVVVRFFDEGEWSVAGDLPAVTEVSDVEELRTAISCVGAGQSITIAVANDLNWVTTDSMVVNGDVTIKPVEGKKSIKLDGPFFLPGNGTLNLENVTVAMSAGKNTGIKNTNNISQTMDSIIALWTESTVNLRNCVVEITHQGNSGITAWWSKGTGTNINVYDTTFNCKGQRPVRSDSNVTLERCTFDNPYRYAVQLTSKASTVADVENAVVNFKNNKIVAGTTSDQPVYGVQLEGTDYGCSNLIINCSGNTIDLNGTSKDFAMYYCECGNVDHDTITWNVDEDPVHKPWDGTTITSKDDLNVVKEETLGANGKAANKIEIITAADFAGIMANISQFDNLTITLKNDIDLNNHPWKPAHIDGYNKLGNCEIVIDGGDHTISGLNVNVENGCAGLIDGTWAGATEVYFKNLTIADSKIVGDADDSSGTAGVGVFIGYPQASAVISFENCHIENTSVEGGHWAGGFYGIAGGYNGTDGPVHMKIIAKDCSVSGLTVTSKGSVGGFAGHAINDANTDLGIENLTISNTSVKSSATGKVKAGKVFGTLGCGPITVVGLNLEGKNTATCNGEEVTGRIYGRQGSKGCSLTLEGNAVTLPGDGIDINGNPITGA